jgi:Fic family protein
MPRSTGAYVRQPGGYRAFIPKPLPPNPSIRMDDDMLHRLSRANRALGRLDGSIQTLPNPDLFVFMYVRKEAVLSSQIEGTQASLNDVLQVEARVLTSEQPNDVGEVLNYANALNYGLERLQTLPLSLRLFREIHERLMHEVRGYHSVPGEFRISQNWIGPAGCTLGDATFVPPPPDELQRVLGEFETFLHANAPLPALIKIGLAHAQFETVHPFLDGNGRIGRLLITFLLCEQEILLKPVLYLSHYFKANRQRYYELLQATRDTGDFESWLKFFLTGVAEVSLEATETARRIVSLREQHRALVVGRLGRSAGSGIALVEHLFQHPLVTVPYVANLLGVTYPSANSLMERLQEHEIVNEVTGHRRNRVFAYEPYIDLFA